MKRVIKRIGLKAEVEPSKPLTRGMVVSNSKCRDCKHRKSMIVITPRGGPRLLKCKQTQRAVNPYTSGITKCDRYRQDMYSRSDEVLFE